ncbi:hypothetical protein PoB_002373100 [Plakobranchus ocellatus]|uniref:Uncharacterized protein n=1 Tax=Plakobranchus ocellatus TaxID=259542 RepID=A0AAV3ZRU8_9GAST|nr:hypothetical protein PoB_002373100 [Plakobranchus ocellatus]
MDSQYFDEGPSISAGNPNVSKQAYEFNYRLRFNLDLTKPHLVQQRFKLNLERDLSEPGLKLSRTYVKPRWCNSVIESQQSNSLNCDCRSKLSSAYLEY